MWGRARVGRRAGRGTCTSARTAHRRGGRHRRSTLIAPTDPARLQCPGHNRLQPDVHRHQPLGNSDGVRRRRVGCSRQVGRRLRQGHLHHRHRWQLPELLYRQAGLSRDLVIGGVQENQTEGSVRRRETRRVFCLPQTLFALQWKLSLHVSSGPRPLVEAGPPAQRERSRRSPPGGERRHTERQCQRQVIMLALGAAE